MEWILETQLSYELWNVNILRINRNQRTVVFIIPEITSTEEQILYMATTAAKLGHFSHIVTNKCSVYIQLWPNLKLHVVGSFIPDTIKGYLGNVFYVVKSLYACLWLFVRKWALKPNLVISKGPLTMLPFLKEFGRFHIVHCYTFNEGHLKNRDSCRGKPNWEFLRLLCADQILISSKWGGSIFHDIFPTLKDPIVFYKCVNPFSFNGCSAAMINDVVEITLNAIIYICFGPMHKNNFELAIEAFSLVLQETKDFDTTTYENLYLIIITTFKNPEQYNAYQAYVHRFQGYLKFCRRTSVILMNNPSLAERKSLLKRTIAVIFPTMNETYMEYKIILEAGYMGKPVIGIWYGLGSEIIHHGANGLILPPNPWTISYYMLEILYNETFKKKLEDALNIFYRGNFSEDRFAHQLEKLIQHCTG